MKTKRYGTLFMLLLFSGLFSARAQNAGDILFTAFNADGNDGFAFVVLNDIPANTNIWFSDEEWNGSAFATATSEGDVVWSDTVLTPAGTVIEISNLSLSSISVNIGTVASGSNSQPALGASGETVYAYTGTQRNPTTFLTAFANSGFTSTNGVLTGTGLAANSTAINFTNGHDVFEYTGAKSQQLDFSDYQTLVGNTANWVSEDGSGDQSNNSVEPDQPFDVTSFSILVPPSEGDVVFIGFNADGSDGLSLVFLADCPPNTEIWFNDNEWNGLAIGGSGAFNTGEGAYKWSDTNMIAAGTVLYLSTYTTSGMTASFGTVTAGSIPNAGYSNSGEVVYCYLGTQTAPTTFLSAITNGTFATNGSIDNTGLINGTNAITLTAGADIAEYIGARSGQATFDNYLPMIMSSSNWISEDGSGDQSNNSTAPDAPFNTTPFTIGTTDIVPPTAFSTRVLSSTMTVVKFSEYLDSATASNTANYVFSPALSVTSVSLNATQDSVFLTHASYTNGIGYTLSIEHVEDTASNIMDSTAFNLVWNQSIPSLVITEIIHSPNTMEMIEVFNSGSSTVQLGGLKFTNGTTGNFPIMALMPDSTILFSTDPSSAASLMGGNYYTLGAGLSSSSDILVIRNSVNQVIDSVTYNTVSPWPVFSGSAYANSIELNAANLDNNVGSNWHAPTQHFTSTNGEIYATPGVYPPPAATSSGISLVVTRSSVSETTTSVQVVASLSGASTLATSVDLQLTSYGTATVGTDFIYPSTQSFSFPANATQLNDTITITIVNDVLPENSEYAMFQLANPVNCAIGSGSRYTLMINDNDIVAPTASQELKLQHVASYSHTGSASGNSAEIVAYDSASQRLFIANSIANKVDIVNFSNPSSPTAITSINISSYGSATSIAVKNGVVAVSIAVASAVDSGYVVFFTTSGAYINDVKVGILPDMVAFNHSGTRVLTANEAQPNDNYSADPEGSISIINISGGLSTLTQAQVSHATFTSFNSQAATLIASGVRITGPSGTTVAKDMEPEYIAISDDDATAFVTCQENNAIAVVNIASSTVTNIFPLGYKNHMSSANALDANDQLSNIEIANWPLRGLFMPDGIDHFSVNNVNYLITANEGDAREYDGYEDVQRLSSLNLDSVTFPNRDFLKSNIGRMTVINTNGDIDNDGDFDQIYTMGSRSFSIWNATTGALVYDSGKDFELINAQHPTLAALFNASNSNNNFKNRSDDKGPEPENVTTAVINGNNYAFVALERIGGVMVYNVTQPQAPVFVDYVNNRNLSSFGGDNGPEGIVFIKAEQSPSGKPYVIIANEVSATLSIYEVQNVQTETYTLGATDLITTYGSFDINEGGFSGMSVVPGETNEFYVVGDRGPNADASSASAATGATLFFPTPTYSPKIHRIRAEADTIAILETMTIKRPDSTNATGIPNPASTGGTGEVAWSDTAGTTINPDFYGIDSEGIIEGLENDFWMADEYGASVWNVSKEEGVLINRYWPFDSMANNLPIDTIFKYRRPNRGFEGVALTPNGKVYACIQSGMLNNSTTIGNTTRLLRILEIDPATGNTQMFGYQLEAGIGGGTGIRTRDWKLGDLVAINNNEFLVIEHAERGGYNSKKVFKFDISNATPITTETYGSTTFEGLLTAAAASTYGIQMVEKSLYLDILASGWDLTLDKPEGLTIINDTTIAVVNDNDFGIDAPNADGVIVQTGKQTKLYIYHIPTSLRSPLHLCQPIRIQTSGAMEFCEGGSAAIDVITGENYTWYNGSTSLSTSATSLTVDSSGSYYAMSMDSACESTSRTIAITVNPVPTVDLGSDIELCAGDTAMLTAPAGMTTYQWSNGGSAQSTSVMASSTFTVTVTNANGCENQDEVLVTVNSLPNIDLGMDTSICVGDSIMFIATSGMTSYLWSNSATTQAVSIGAAGTYAVTVVDANACENSDDIVLTLDTLPAFEIADATVCDGDMHEFNGPSGLSYQWSNSQSSQSIMVSAAGNYTLTATDANGCSGLDSATLFLNDLPVVQISGDTAFCSGGSVSLSAGAFSAYQWSNNDTVASISITAGGIYSVIVTDSNNCSNSDSITVTENALPNVSAGSDVEVCDGESVTLSGSGALTYQWSNSVANGVSFVPSASGNYTVTGTDANGCDNSDVVSVTVNDNPAINLGTDTVICEGSSIVLNAGSGFSSYSWSNSASSQSITVNAADAGTYAVTVIDDNGCEGSDEILIEVNDCLGIATTTASEWSIFPNPVNANLNITIPSNGNSLKAEVRDALGKIVYTEKLSNNSTINVSSLPSGLYFITLSDNKNNNLGVKRFIVNH